METKQINYEKREKLDSLVAEVYNEVYEVLKLEDRATIVENFFIQQGFCTQISILEKNRYAVIYANTDEEYNIYTTSTKNHVYLKMKVYLENIYTLEGIEHPTKRLDELVCIKVLEKLGLKLTQWTSESKKEQIEHFALFDIEGIQVKLLLHAKHVDEDD